MEVHSKTTQFIQSARVISRAGGVVITRGKCPFCRSATHPRLHRWVLPALYPPTAGGINQQQQSTAENIAVLPGSR